MKRGITIVPDAEHHFLNLQANLIQDVDGQAISSPPKTVSSLNM
jgi:hypothetical protein